MKCVKFVTAVVLSGMLKAVVAEPVKLVCTDVGNPALTVRYTLDVEAQKVSNLFFKMPECTTDAWSDASIKFSCGPGGVWKSEFDRSTGIMRHIGAMASVYPPFKCEKDVPKF